MIARRSLLPILNTALGALMGLVALKVVAVYYGREVYGQFEAALAVLGILFVFADLAMGSAHVKRVSEGRDPADAFATYAAFQVFSAGVVALAAVGGFLLYTKVLGRTLEDTTVPALGFVLVYYIAKAGQGVIQSTFDAKLETARSQLGNLVETIARSAFLVWSALVFAALAHGTGPLLGRVEGNGVLAWIRDNPAGAVGLASALGSITAALAMVPYLHGLRGGRFRWDILRSYFAFALPIFLPNAVGVLMFYVDRAVLFFFGTSLDTADFAAPRRIVTVLENVGGALLMILFPAISTMVSTGSRDQVAPTLDRAIRYLSIGLLPVTAFLAFFPGPIVSIVLQDEWQGGAPVLSLLAVYAFLYVVSRPHYALLLGHGHVRPAARIAIIVSLTNLALNLILIPDDIKMLGIRLFGLKALGAAIATLASGALGYVLLQREARRLEGYAQKAHLWKHALAALAMAGSIWLVDTTTPLHLHRWYSVIGFGLFGTLVYAAALVALREITRDDVRFVGDTIHPGQMWRYLRSELGRRRS